MINHTSSTDPVTVVLHYFEDDNENEVAILEESWSDDIRSKVEWRLIEPQPIASGFFFLAMLCKELEIPYTGEVSYVVTLTIPKIIEKLKAMLIGES